MDLGAQKAHPVNVQCLPFGVLFPHKDLTFHIHQGSSRGGGNTVLTGSCLSDDTGLSHPFGKKDLSQYVVDLVGSGVIQVLTLEVNFGSAQILGHMLCIIKTGGSSGVLV